MDIRIVDFRTMGKRVDFTVGDTYYHTDKNGEGLWIGEDYMKQIRGTLDFSLKQKTRGGVTKALNRYFND